MYNEKVRHAYTVPGFAAELKSRIKRSREDLDFDPSVLLPEVVVSSSVYLDKEMQLVDNYARRMLNDAYLGSSSSCITCFGDRETKTMLRFCEANGIEFVKTPEHNNGGPNIFVLKIGCGG